MNKKLYVGGLPYDTTSAQLRELFAPHGTVVEVTLPTDRDTGRPRGFGFVEMSTQAEAEKAIQALNGTTFNGRTLTVNPAREQRSGGGRYRR